jgi:lipopolysaccharide biosynthesis protein/SAM-dependent methyltransferase
MGAATIPATICSRGNLLVNDNGNVYASHQRDTALADVMRRLCVGDELLWAPERLVPFEHWVGHIPFAFWLVKVLRPRLLVELGTHRGNSYCAFCQAVSTLGLDSRALAVDTWQGDVHMGHEEGVLADLRRHHDPRYDTFSTLLEMTFDSARAHVDTDSVDLLHIDGAHTYEIVRHDFDTWRDTLSSRAIVLFHDTAVHREPFGVWRLWAELSRQHPSFAFSHSYGLGVLGVGSELPIPLQEFFALSQEPGAATRTRALFEARGQGLVTRLKAEQEEVRQTSLAKAFGMAEEKAAALTRALETERAEREAERAEREAERAAIEAERAECEAATALAAQRAEREAATALAAGRAEREATRAALNDSQKELEELRGRGRRRDATIHNLHLEINRLAQDNASVQLMQSRLVTSVQLMQSRLVTIEASTFWRATWPLRRALAAIPPTYRRRGRQAAMLLWWTATLRLAAKLRGVQEARAQIDDPETAAIALDPTDTDPASVALPDMSRIQTHVPRARIAAVVHLYYPEVWFELREALDSISEPFDLFVSVTESVAECAIRQIESDFPMANIIVFGNHGRDILPFFTFAATGVLNKYDLVCKLHGKRTLHRPDGDSWRQALLGGILRDKSLVQRIIASFEADPDLGIVVADGHVFGARPEHWVDDRARVLELGARIGLEHVPDGATFPGGSIFWMRPFLLRTLLAFRLVPTDFEPEPLPRDGSTAHAVERLVGLVCGEAGMRIEESGALPFVPAPIPRTPLRIIAHYLPQYHPIPENDAWWGKGFTEWTNVTRMRPLFRHHYQPRLPADLGFYDLRVAETRDAQADLARQYGIDGFCYYYYWFNGRGILRQPLDDMVASGRPDFPFMLCWANEPWSRNWDGSNREVLLPQDYAPGWSRTLARDIAPLLTDPRYIRIDGRPMLAIYRVMHIPDRVDALNELRDELRCLRIGDIHLSGGLVGFQDDDEPPEDPSSCGLDSWYEFPPHRLPAARITETMQEVESGFTGAVYSYRNAIENSLAGVRLAGHARRYRAVMAGWDNTPRRPSSGHAFHGATPALLRRWLRAVVSDETRHTGDSERVVFVNAWNEWAEGTYLEPDREFGRGWLEAVASAIGGPVVPNNIAMSGAGEGLPSRYNGLSEAQWLDVIIAQAEGHTPAGVSLLPAFPAAEWQQQFTGSSNAHAMREAFKFYTLMKEQAAKRGMHLGARSQVLDFGCGWGRYLRLLMRDVGPKGLHGADVDPDMIGFCRVSGLPAQFSVLPPQGPAPYANESFDLVFAYSVFSHLSEAAFTSWMQEFGRILRPDGLLIFTTQSRRFLNWTVELRQCDPRKLSVWEQSLCSAFPDIDETVASFNAGRFVFAPTGGG